MSTWQLWALGSAIFAALTAITGKVGMTGVDSNLATAIRVVVIGIFAWGIVYMTDALPLVGWFKKRESKVCNLNTSPSD